MGPSLPRRLRLIHGSVTEESSYVRGLSNVLQVIDGHADQANGECQRRIP